MPTPDEKAPRGSRPPSTNRGDGDEQRPDFLTALGLLPPVSLEDVEQAFRLKVRSAHPDTGGSQAAFLALQQAYEQAKIYAQYFTSRRQWLGAQTDRYLHQATVLDELTRRGGQYELEHLDWLDREIGADFAQLLDRVSGVRLTGSNVGDLDLAFLADFAEVFSSVTRLDLSNSAITDDALGHLANLPGLVRLDLSGTGVSHRGLEVLESLASLEWLNLDNTKVGAIRAMRLRHNYPQIEIVH
ncbi:MAG: hypothetical protein AB7U73_22420 [Pirellulales bacterium]